LWVKENACANDRGQVCTFGMIPGLGTSGAGQILFGTVAGGVTSRLQGGNFWEGAAIGLTVGLLNHAGNKLFEPMRIRAEIQTKYPGLYKVLSKLQSYVKNHPSILESMSLFSGYSDQKVLSLLSIGNLAKMVLVGGTDAYGEFFGDKTKTTFDPTHVHIRTNIASSIDTGGFQSKILGIFESVNGTSFFAGVTILHEIVHYGRYWNGLPHLVGPYEAGQMFEKRVFGFVTGINNSSKNATIYDWKF
jgi:hypothetical protein